MARSQGNSRSQQRSLAYEFKAVKGSRLSNDEAKRIGPELARISERDGALHAEAVVEAARSPRSKLHKHFEWDTEKAAQRHWLSTARHLIRSIQISVTIAPQEAPQEIRAFVKIDNTIGYKPMTEVLRSSDLREMWLTRALEELRVWQDRYAKMKDFVEIFGDVGPILKRAEAQLRKVA